MDYQNKQLNNYHMPEVKKIEKKVSFYDPVVNAFREIPVSMAKKYITGLEKIKKEIEKLDK